MVCRVRDPLFFHFKKLCPTCRNYITLSRNLIIQQIIEKLDEIQPENEEHIEMPKIQKWGNGLTVANLFYDESDSLLISVDKDDESIIELKEKSSEFEKYVEDLLECPVCLELIKTTPILQCAGGHVICNDCIPKLYHCPICRNYSKLSRNLIIEQIIENVDEIQPENKELIEKPKIPKWANRSISAKSIINDAVRSIIVGVILFAILSGFVYFLISIFPCFSCIEMEKNNYRSQYFSM